jgi:periplasmic divalent cation tolerance protein
MRQIVLFYVPFPDEHSARSLSDSLLKEKLIACANFFTGNSHYVWNQQACHEDEVIAIFKTLQEKQALLEEFIHLHHPYDTPCILHWNAHCNAPYFEWIKQQIK